MLSNNIPRKLTPAEIEARELAFYADDDNWIEFSVSDAPYQPFTLFHSGSQKQLYQGKLDGKGYAYIKLPPKVGLVDVVFDKQDEYRPWYYDVPLQLLGGVRDAGQNTLNLLGEGIQAKVKLDRAEDFLNPLQVLFEYITRKDENQTLGDTILQQDSVVHANNEHFANPFTLPDVDAPTTMSGALTRGAAQFLVGFVTGYKIIKPLTKIGPLVKGMVAGVIADSTMFAPNEERLSDLVESFPVLHNPITTYLQSNPDDSTAEGRLKNALEGLLLGAVLEPFMRSLRLLKYARIRLPITEVRTKVHYKFEVVYPKDIHFEIKLPSHMATLDGFTQRSGISGAHNAEAFYAAGEKYNIRIEREIPTSVRGITTIEYRIPAIHPQTRKITHYKGDGARPFQKTIYDPNIFSDQKMLELSQEAAAKGYRDALNSAKGTTDVTIEGIEFRIYMDKETGMIRNVHPQ